MRRETSKRQDKIILTSHLILHLLYLLCRCKKGKVGGSLSARITNLLFCAPRIAATYLSFSLTAAYGSDVTFLLIIVTAYETSEPLCGRQRKGQRMWPPISQA